MSENKIKKARFGSLQPDVEPLLDLNSLTAADFAPATSAEKESFIQDRKSVSYWHDAWRRLRKNTVAMVALGVIIILVLFAFVGPAFVPYSYSDQIRGSENLFYYHYTLEDQARLNEKKVEWGSSHMTPEEAVAAAEEKAAAEGKTLTAVDKAKIRAEAKSGTDSNANAEMPSDKQLYAEMGIKAKPFGYSNAELKRMDEGENVFPHVFGCDYVGRDVLVRVMYGTRISMIVGLAAALLVLVIGSLYGSISGFAGGRVDMVMQRVVDVIYALPEVLVIMLLAATLKPTMQAFMSSGNGPLQSLVTVLGPNIISMFIAFASLYWVGMSRIIRAQVLTIKNQEYVTAAKALGASNPRVIRRHLLPNCIGQIVATTCLQIPSAIFLESFLSYLGVGVTAPLTSLGSMASDAFKAGIYTYPHLLFIPAVILSVMILSFNLFGDGLRDALDPRLKK